MDKRSEPRFLQHIRLFAHVSACAGQPNLVGSSLACEGVDFSTHGLQFHAASALPPQTLVNITLGVRDPFAMFLLSGEIRWVRGSGEDWYMGVLLRDQAGTDLADWSAHFEEVFG